jgi:SAM-dependent methyltransferase
MMIPLDSRAQNVGKLGDYETEWNKYVEVWKSKPKFRALAHLGDEWTGEDAGAAESLNTFESMIEESLIKPYIGLEDDVLEIGVGGGKTSSLLLKHCHTLTCADISSEMLKLTKWRLGDDRVTYKKLDGLTLNGIEKDSVDVCFSFDTLVHVEPRDIFNYLTLLPTILKGKRLCILHHANILTDLGWQLFLQEWKDNLMGSRLGCPFSVMTDAIMERFLTHLGYKIIHKDTKSVPRDCIWICRAPED